jgi:nucleoid-associated protein YgaU
MYFHTVKLQKKYKMPHTNKKIYKRKRKGSILKLLSGNISLLFFVATLFLLGAFLSKVYLDDKYQPEKSNSAATEKENLIEADKTVEQEKVEETVKTQAGGTNIEEINKLTKQLLAEQEKSKNLSQQLSSQNQKLKTLLQKAMDKADSKDKAYISALNSDIKKEKPIIANKDTLEKTDYYNKVRVSLNAKNQTNELQNQLNQFIGKEVNKDRDIKYVKNLKKESDVRNNEVRSIKLKKGDTIWRLAKRAYGNGLLYKKIIKANPQITEKNARFLRVGTLIRVPK